MGALVNINIENGKIKATVVYSADEVPAVIYDEQGEAIETTEYNGQDYERMRW